MKRWLVALLFTCFGVTAYSDCPDDASTLVAALEKEALGELSDTQRQKAIAVIEQSCQDKKQAQTGEDAAEKKDAFTEMFLNGESADKPGNKRLKRMSH